MSGFKEPSFADRQKAAQEARKNILEKFKAKPGLNDPAVLQRQAEREAQAAERAKAKLAREAAKAEQKAREAEAARAAATAPVDCPNLRKAQGSSCGCPGRAGARPASAASFRGRRT